MQSTLKPLVKRDRNRTKYPGVCQYCLNYWLWDNQSWYHFFKFICPQCDPQRYEDYWQHIGQIRERQRKRRTWYHKIKRRMQKKKPPQLFPKCEKCGGPRHSIHHIKPVGDFETGTEISIINNPINLIVLCEECHAKEHYRRLV